MKTAYARAVLPFALESLDPAIEVEPHGNYFLVTGIDEGNSTGLLVAVATRLSFVERESPQVTLSDAAVTKLETAAADFEGGIYVEPAYGYVVRNKAEGSLDVVVVPASVHHAEAGEGKTFAVGERRNGRVYRRDRFEEASRTEGVLTARVSVANGRNLG